MTEHQSEQGVPDPVAVRFIDPRHGTHDPTAGSPRRRPGSVRRTTTVDAHRPEGFAGDLVLSGRGRDLVTGADGAASVAATARTDLVIDYRQGQVVRSATADPRTAGVDALVGSTAARGFRRAIDEAVDVPSGSLVHLLLDEVPGSTLVSGYALVHAVHHGELDAEQAFGSRPRGGGRQVPDLCAGYQVGGVIQTGLQGDGIPPIVTGPDAPSVLDPDDPSAWHDAPELSARDMRRARRHDLWRDDEGHLHVDAFFRDSHVAPDGLETVVHEYSLEAVVDGEDGIVLSCRAVPRVLPWTECPQAVDSARRVEGMPVGTLRSRVHAELVGPTTCTHLNDTLRELEDVLALAPLLPG